MRSSLSSIITLVGAIAVAGIFASVFYLQSNSYLDLMNKRAKSEAIDGCFKTSSYTYTNAETGVTTVEPIEKTYTKCLELKGIK